MGEMRTKVLGREVGRLRRPPFVAPGAAGIRQGQGSRARNSLARRTRPSAPAQVPWHVSHIGGRGAGCGPVSRGAVLTDTPWARIALGEQVLHEQLLDGLGVQAGDRTRSGTATRSRVSLSRTP